MEDKIFDYVSKAILNLALSGITHSENELVDISSCSSPYSVKLDKLKEKEQFWHFMHFAEFCIDVSFIVIMHPHLHLISNNVITSFQI
ncbi:MAG: hypothetical protein RR064_06345 [Oscillospiraceae bacterium]